MELSPDQQQVRQWLQTDAGQKALALAARWVRKKMATSGVPLSVLGLPPSADPAEIEAHIASELALVILENRSRICTKLAPPEANRGRILSAWLFRRLLDRARASPGQQRLRYLYKHAADLFRDAPEIHTRATARHSWFSLAAQSREIGPLAEDEVAAIPWPPALAGVCTMETVNRQENLLRLARWFWERVSDLFGGEPVWVPVRDLVYWIGRHVSLKPDPIASLDDPSTEAPRYQDAWFDAEKVRQWAGMLVDRLTLKQQEAVYYHYFKGLNLENTAARMGLNTASSVKYHLDQVAEKVQSFSADLRWLSPDAGVEANPLARDLFMETLGEFLKKRFSLP